MSTVAISAKSSKRIPDEVYADYVKARVSLLLERRWYPSSLDRGYIERCWIDGKDPDVIAQEFVDHSKEKS